MIFQSGADNFAPGSPLGMHYYLRDTATGTTELLSVTPAGEPGLPHGFNTFRLDVTPGGRFAVFATDAADLVGSADTNNRADVFLRDRDSGVTERIGMAWDGSEPNDSNLGPAISDDGRYVVFQSFATNLVPSDNNGQDDVFLYDRQLRQTRLISAGTDGNPANGYSGFPDISGDGRFVVFHSAATNLVAEDTSSDYNVFLYDVQTGTLELASRYADGSKAPGWDPKLQYRRPFHGLRVHRRLRSGRQQQQDRHFHPRPPDRRGVLGQPGLRRIGPQRLDVAVQNQRRRALRHLRRRRLQPRFRRHEQRS